MRGGGMGAGMFNVAGEGGIGVMGRGSGGGRGGGRGMAGAGAMRAAIVGSNPARITVDDLVWMLTTVVAPDTWDEPGEGEVVPLGTSLVVRQTAAVHQEIEKLLGQLRAVYGMGEELQALDAIKVDWGSDPFSQGGYTSPSVGGCGVWRELRDSGCDRLLLAGEAVGERGSTVCSALESAEWAAARLDRTFGSRAVAD